MKTAHWAKRLAAVALVVVFSSAVLCASGCAEEKQSFAINYSDAETMQMSSHMNGGRYYVDDNVLYGVFHNKNGVQQFAMQQYDSISTLVAQGDPVVLDANCEATFINKSGDTFYYCRTDMGDNSTTIVAATLSKKEVEKKDGDKSTETKYEYKLDKKVLSETGGMYLQLRNGTLYYTDKDHHFCSMNTQGGDQTTIISNKEVYYTYVISDDLVIYEDETNGQTIHIFNMATQADTALTEVKSGYPTISGSFVYCTTTPDNNSSLQRHLTRVSLNTLKVEEASGWMGPNFAIDVNNIYGSNDSSVSRNGWSQLSDTLPDDGIKANVQFVSASVLVSYVYDTTGHVSAIKVKYVSTGNTVNLARTK